MSKIIEYMVVYIGDVQSAIEHGWQPYGSPYYAAPNKFQAMVKYEEERKLLKVYDEASIVPESAYKGTPVAQQAKQKGSKK